jgi:hypothetical protein
LKFDFLTAIAYNYKLFVFFILFLKTKIVKKLFSVIGLIILVLTSNAQGRKISFGVAAGIDVANMTFKANESNGDSHSANSRIGFKGYLFCDIPISELFSIQSELGYDGLGFKENKGFVSPTDPGSTVQLNYATLSILPKIKIKGTGLSFFLGPSFGLLLSSSVSNVVGTTSGSSFYKSTDVFGAVGAEYYLGNGFGISARYMHGLTDISKDTYVDEQIHNSAFGFVLAYKFRSGK